MHCNKYKQIAGLRGYGYKKCHSYPNKGAIMKKLPLGIQSFRKIIEGGYVYADKTKYIYDLISDTSYYFLSRPRRFGKSLLLDTIAEAFGGEKELFKDLFLYNSGYNFEMYPVLRIDMSNIASDTPEDLKTSLSNELKNRVEAEGLDNSYDLPSDIFKTLIEAMHRKYGKRVVVLIDEYDKPILDRLTDAEIADGNRNVLRGFYGVLKSMDPYLRFTFITGVTKFTKTSVFSGLNNLFDMTMAEEYANICGITIDDLGESFGEHIESLSKLDRFKRYDSLTDEILAWYDGYSWDGETRVINPFSLLSFFAQKKFSSFWYSSGTPKFLLDMIKQRPKGFTDLNNLKMGEWALDAFDILKLEVEPLLFQTGYLTVKSIVPDSIPDEYILDVPNYEVRMAFNLHIIAEFTESGTVSAQSAYQDMKDSLNTGNLQKMLNILRGLFASIPYEIHISNEHYYHSIFTAIMNLLGFRIDAEVSVSGGRIDAVLELGDKIYVMEFKYVKCEKGATTEKKQALSNDALEKGMKQIMDRGYANKYKGSGKAVYEAAFAFLGRDDIEMRCCVSH